MSVLFVLIPFSVALSAGFVAACLVAIRSGQFDDLESPRWRVLFDDPDLRGASPASLISKRPFAHERPTV